MQERAARGLRRRRRRLRRRVEAVGRGPLEVALHLASMLTTGNNAPGKSVFQEFMGLLIGIFSIKVANRYKIAISYRRIELVFDRSNAALTAVKSKL